MSIVVYPLNNIDFTAEDAAIYSSTRTSGIYAGDDFAISLTGADNTISIDVGLAWMRLSRFNGVAAALKSKTYVDMGLPNPTFPRIDALVLQFDANKNGAELVSKQGIAASTPQPPAVSRTEALYELHLLHVLRNPGAASITAADVTDLRLNEQYCGLMADAVTRVDTAAINAQVTALIQKLRDDLKSVQDQTYYASRTEVEESIAQANAYSRKIAGLYNHLVNSDFSHFVAQAGVGGKHIAQAYAGDRWILVSGSVTGTARADGEGYTNITLNGTIRQIVANPPATASPFVEMVSGAAQISYANGAVTITSSGGVIKNAALYEGNYTTGNRPVYRPNRYGAELAECQRYYLRGLGSNVLGTYASSGARFYALIPTPVTMRATPAVNMLQSQSVVSVTYEAGTAQQKNNTDAIQSVGSPTLQSNGVKITCTTTNSPGAYVPGVIYDGFNVEMSADL